MNELSSEQLINVGNTLHNRALLLMFARLQISLVLTMLKD